MTDSWPIRTFATIEMYKDTILIIGSRAEASTSMSRVNSEQLLRGVQQIVNNPALQVQNGIQKQE